MKKYYFLIIVALILGLVLTGCSLLSNISQVPTTGQSGVTYLTKAVPLSPYLIGLWHFDEGTGDDAYDSSGYDNDGTLHNFSVPYGWVTGMFGSALSFDGVDDYVLVDNTISAPLSITVEAWVKRQGTPGTYKYIISKYYVLKAGAWSSYAFYTGSTGGLYFYIGGETTYRLSPNAGTDIWDGEWHHIAGTFDDASDNLKLYVDGVLVFGTPSGTALAIGYDSGDLYFGTYRFPNGHWSFSGTIDEVRIWDGALTDIEIEYNSLLRYVEIDIKPGSDPNSINLGSNGVVPVAILGSVDFDAATVIPSTVTLAGAAAKLKGNSGNSGSLEDVNGDGYLDLVVQIYTIQLGLTIGNTVATLNADTHEGGHITGSDLVQIVQSK